MMKLIMIVVLLLGLVVVGMAGIAQARAMARSVNIVSRIADLRQEDNLAKCQEVETDAHQGLRKIQHSFAPIMWIGTMIAACGLVGIIATGRKTSSKAANTTSEPIVANRAEGSR
jgi:hypothetical protein